MAWIGLVGAIAGAVAGAALAFVADWLNARRQAKRNLSATAWICVDRLTKLRLAAERQLDQVLANEFKLLGGDMDRYRDAIAQQPGARESHWPIYERMVPVLLAHETAGLEQLAEDLRRV